MEYCTALQHNMPSVEITVIAIVFGVLMLSILLCACGRRNKLQQREANASTSVQSRNQQGGRPGSRSPTASANGNVFVITLDGARANNAPPPEYKWEELPPPSYDEAIKNDPLQEPANHL
ncbi:hypothetical protein OUZ56_031541 [Daphnia magna]|uniref:Uncharacterized protein n=2 Tax=Daphnia magna TaxID=35525 RepID=A0ABQ9ZUV6_9CRUS|nr:hypothetical protein OUZ56_031541 [Daphnia magna]